MPAAIASRTCSGPSGRWARGPRQRASAAMTPANETAFSVNVTAGPIDPISRPAIAGPTARARLTLAPLRRAARGTSSRGTSSGWTAANDGADSAFPAPMVAVSRRSSAGVVACAKVRMARAPAPASMIVWLTIRSRRRSKMSPRLPAGSTSRNTGSVVAVCTSDTLKAPPPRSPINHWAPTVWAHVPMLPTNCAIQIARKTRRRNGAHTESSAALKAALEPGTVGRARRSCSALRRLRRCGHAGQHLLGGLCAAVVDLYLVAVRAGGALRVEVPAGAGGGVGDGAVQRAEHDRDDEAVEQHAEEAAAV